MNIFPFFKQPSRPGSSLRPLSRPSLLWLFYGLYAVLCQLAGILLHTRIQAESVSDALLALRFAPMLEHALMSLVILAIGVYLMERTVMERKE